MFRCSLASCLLVFIVCSFCGKDFKSLGRHVWRCKEKGKLNNKDKKTIADLSKTWVIENLDSIVSGYVRKWLELHISATISSLILKKSRHGINLVLPSTKFIECQTVIRNSLKSSPNFDIKAVWAELWNQSPI